jgi:integrase
MPRKKTTFPYPFSKNGRHGSIYLCGNGKFKTHFMFAHKAHQNTFSTFDKALDFLSTEFNTLDTSLAESQSQFPLSRDRKHYYELEQKLKVESDNASLWQAVDFYIAHHKRKKFSPLAFKDCYEKFIQSQIANNVSTSQIKNLKKHLGRFARTFGSKKIHDIDVSEIQQWFDSQKDSRTGQAWGPKTKKNYRGSLVALSLYARKTLKAIPENGEETEFQKIVAPKRKTNQPIEIFSKQEMTKLLIAAIATDIDLIPILVLGGFMGLRPAEAHGEDVDRPRLRWEHFIWRDKTLPIYGQKVNSKPTRDVPIPANAVAWLAPFKKLKGEIWSLKSAFDGRFSNLRKQAGVRDIYDGLRHSYCSYRYRILKGNIDQVADEMGNSREEVIRSYKRNVTDKAANAWFAIKPPADYAKMIKLALNLRQAT